MKKLLLLMSVLSFISIVGTSVRAAYADVVIHTGDINNQTTIENSINTNNLSIQCNCTPTPTVVTPTEVLFSPTPIPTVVPTSENTPAPIPTPTPSPEQAVLGTNAFAATGEFSNTLMNTAFGFGALLLWIGYFSFRKEKN